MLLLINLCGVCIRDWQNQFCRWKSNEASMRHQIRAELSWAEQYKSSIYMQALRQKWFAIKCNKTCPQELQQWEYQKLLSQSYSTLTCWGPLLLFCWGGSSFDFESLSFWGADSSSFFSVSLGQQHAILQIAEQVRGQNCKLHTSKLAGYQEARKLAFMTSGWQ